MLFCEYADNQGVVVLACAFRQFEMGPKHMAKW